MTQRQREGLSTPSSFLSAQGYILEVEYRERNSPFIKQTVPCQAVCAEANWADIPGQTVRKCANAGIVPLQSWVMCRWEPSSCGAPQSSSAVTHPLHQAGLVIAGGDQKGTKLNLMFLLPKEPIESATKTPLPPPHLLPN